MTTTHFTLDTDSEGWREPFCGIDGDDTSDDLTEVTCWECMAIAGCSDDEIEAACAPSDFGGDGPVLRAIAAQDWATFTAQRAEEAGR